jgi:hypothetical protein
MHLSLPCPICTARACYCQQISIRFRPVNVVVLNGRSPATSKRGGKPEGDREDCQHARERQRRIAVPVWAFNRNRQAARLNGRQRPFHCGLASIPSAPIWRRPPPGWPLTGSHPLKGSPCSLAILAHVIIVGSIVLRCSSSGHSPCRPLTAAAGIGCKLYHLYGCGAKSRSPFSVVDRTIFAVPSILKWSRPHGPPKQPSDSREPASGTVRGNGGAA